MKYESIHIQQDIVLYVPCFQRNPTSENEGAPMFNTRLDQASPDLKKVQALRPDYVLTLSGKFDAKTQPFDLSLVAHNSGVKADDADQSNQVG